MYLTEKIRGGMLGLLVGDACGVPYEFTSADKLPPFESIDIEPPPGYPRSYQHIPVGTWSDDGAQALCLFVSILASGQYHGHDFASRLLRWYDSGYLAVDNHVFDIGLQTSASLSRLKQGLNTGEAGLTGERNNGNGSLMRSLPLALLHRGEDISLVADAHRQSRLTHKHPRSQVCCALYCLWARKELLGYAFSWDAAVQSLRKIYQTHPDFSRELEVFIQPDKAPHGTGSGYVVDTLHSARLACMEKTYQNVVRRAISLGNDTDTTACVAGGIAGIRYGASAIPPHWLTRLRGKELLAQLDLLPPADKPSG